MNVCNSSGGCPPRGIVYQITAPEKVASGEVLGPYLATRSHAGHVFFYLTPIYDVKGVRWLALLVDDPTSRVFHDPGQVSDGFLDLTVDRTTT